MTTKHEDKTANFPRLIGTRGKAGAGKDTLADYLVAKHGYTKLSFATPLKRIVCIITGWDFDFVNGATTELRALRETKMHPVYNMTCRQLLQFVGTELFRNQLHPEIWVQCLVQDVQTRFESDPLSRIIITDCRFPNETKALTKLGGMILHLKRECSQSCLQGNTAGHASEKDFKVEGECELLNSGTVENLYQGFERLFS